MGPSRMAWADPEKGTHGHWPCMQVTGIPSCRGDFFMSTTFVTGIEFGRFFSLVAAFPARFRNGKEPPRRLAWL